jgi:cystathionine beta-synthase
MPVFNGDTVVGVVHERTILEHALSGGHHNKTVADVADNNYCVVDTDTEVAVLMELFRKVRLAVVMQGGKFVGVLTRIDIIDHIAKVTK